MSNNFGEPDWAAPASSSSAVTIPAPVVESTPATTKTNPPIPSDNSAMVQRLLSLLCIILCGLMTALGVLAMIDYSKDDAKEVKDYPEIFIAAYMVVFAALLFFYEFMWWITIDSLNKRLRKNFGFFYSIPGKAFYIIFVAFLCIGLENERIDNFKWLKWTTAISWLSTGGLLIFLRIWKGDFLQDYQAPIGGLTDNSADDEEFRNQPV
mmetsp:Transcript_23231/g.32703  ORF Transcript_23231/g.32703 Transcript_23231/m.32703 type:complete len:209 (-) Transcript_23231:158-784(-)|eukprot:CAMPEP_0184861298 /NCGR_PEP_ID=MMETSP0580-20130426/6010_1 /TAXON_ID=1118495 /ORGANISM="Dactyliosolen fragilissimus" /LENGTH=208 /DNA_ID=CAMNT_0027358727 /DNA_START=43 /DNA_END=669 /DNA_ORIENTATION=-